MVRYLMKAATKRQPTRWTELSIVLTDDAGIRELHRRYLGDDSPTDVITFRYDGVPPAAPGSASGEIVVNAACALQAGSRHGGAARELALYLAHGCDHLAGNDDRDPAGRRSMRRRELRWLHRPEVADAVPGLLRTGRENP